MEEVDLGDEDPGRSEDAPDPRIQVELERLNTATDTINKLEVDLDEARMLFRQLLADSTHRIDTLAKRLGKCVEQSRPYYDARIRAKQALRETQAAAWRYERATSQHAAAREMVSLAEEGLMEKGCIFDHTWQEMLNHATSKVNDAERDKMESAVEHLHTSARYHEAETRVKALQKELKRAIAKSSLNARRSLLQMNNLVRMHQLQLLPYFELKAAVNQQLEGQKQQVRQLEESVGQAKMTYSQALSNLETISDEIHRNRQCQVDLGVRGIGVGADSPLPPLHEVEGVLPLPTHPLHYSDSSPDAATYEFKSLPGKLGPVAAPIVASGHTIAALPTPTTTTTSSTTSANSTTSSTTSTNATNTTTLASVTSTTSAPTVSSLHAIPDSCVQGGQVGSEARDGKKEASVVEESSEIIVEEVDGGATSNDLSGWQVIGLSNPTLLPAQQYLTVDDRDSTVSDTESLASIEMLSDEAIAGLMLDEELAQASSSIYAASSTPIVEPPLPGSTSIQFLPAFFHNYGGKCLQPGSVVEQCGPGSHSSSDGDCCGITHSLMGLKMDPLTPAARQCQPPLSLSLQQQDSSSEHSSPEDLTPGYAPLRDTPCSPEDFPLSTQAHHDWRYDESASPPITSTSEETQEPHCSSWVLENTPVVQKDQNPK